MFWPPVKAVIKPMWGTLNIQDTFANDNVL